MAKKLTAQAVQYPSDIEFNGFNNGLGNELEYIGSLAYRDRDGHIIVSAGKEIDLGTINNIDIKELKKFFTKRVLRKHI